MSGRRSNWQQNSREKEMPKTKTRLWDAPEELRTNADS